MSMETQQQSHSNPQLRGNSTHLDTRTLVALAMLTALAYFVTFLSNFIPLKVAGFLEFDFKDMVIVIGGFLYGPGAAAMMVVAVSLIQFLTISSTGVVGLGMNLLATGSFACIASLIYWYRPNFKGAVLGLAVGGVSMTALMLVWNYAITPAYMDVPRSVVVDMLVPIFLPFNLVKAGLNMGATLSIYPTVQRSLSKANLVVNPEGNREENGKKAFLIAVMVLTVFVALACAIAEFG
ncbi:MAG: ECF transporter S component [Eubacteriales bacterium]